MNLHDRCRALLEAYRTGRLGQTVMPEDSNPGFSKADLDTKLAYFTLPMALNYQRDSYKLWQAALKSYIDRDTRYIFNLSQLLESDESDVRESLMKHRVALQPNKHVSTWRTIAKTVFDHWGTFNQLFESADNDYLQLQEIVRCDFKKGFPYLSGPKIFNYWSYIISTYGGINLKNRDKIEIAPDTHIIQCSVKLGVLTSSEADCLSRDEISQRWRELLMGSGISPIDMHPPLWFWSKNGFLVNFDS